MAQNDLTPQFKSTAKCCLNIILMSLISYYIKIEA